MPTRLSRLYAFITTRPVAAGVIVSLGLLAGGLGCVLLGQTRLAISAGVAVSAALLLFRYPWLGLVAAFFSISGALAQFVPHFDVGMLCATLGIVATRKALSADYTWRLPPVAIWLLLLLTWTFAGLIWQPLLPITRLQSHWLLIGVMYVLLVWELVRTPRDWRRVLLAVAAGCILTAASTVHEMFLLLTRGPMALSSAQMSQVQMLRFYGHWLGPNMLAHTLMPFAVLLPALLRPDETRGARLLGVVALACAVFSIGLSQSRAGVLALLVGLAVSCYPSVYRARLLALTGVSLAAILLLPFDVTTRFGALVGQTYDASLTYRGFALEAAIDGGMDAFPFGGGFGAFTRYCGVYLPFAIPLFHAHNTYAHLFNEGGVPGLLLLLAVYFHLLRAVWKPLAVETRGSFARCSRFALLGAVLGFFVACLFEQLLHLAQLWAFFGLATVYPYVFGTTAQEAQPPLSRTSPAE